MLPDFRSIWDAHLGPINIARHQINLFLADAKPIHFELYQKGPRVREIDKSEIVEMLSERGIEPVYTKCAKPIVFAQT